MSKIIWIVDNPYGEKFTATRADVNVTSDITREEAKAMLDAPHVWMSAKAEVQCKCVPQEEVKRPLGYSMAESNNEAQVLCPGVEYEFEEESMTEGQSEAHLEPLPGVAKQEYKYSFWD